jgi:hypothetical protein
MKKMGRHVAQEYDLVLEEGKWTMREFTRTGAWVNQQIKLTEKAEMGDSSGNLQALEAAKVEDGTKWHDIDSESGDDSAPN